MLSRGTLSLSGVNFYHATVSCVNRSIPVCQVNKIERGVYRHMSIRLRLHFPADWTMLSALLNSVFSACVVRGKHPFIFNSRECTGTFKYTGMQ